MTGRSLQRKLLSNLRLNARWRDPLLVPMDTRYVLQVVCDLAAGEDGFELRVDPAVDGGRTLVDVVARAGDLVGAEPLVELALKRAVASELLVVSDDGAGLIVPVPVVVKNTSPAKIESNRQNALRSIRRRRGESEEAYQARRVLKNAQVDEMCRAQGSFKLPITGGGQPQTVPQTAPQFSVVGHPNLDANSDPTDIAVPGVLDGVGVGFFARAEYSSSAAAEEKENRRDSLSLSAAAKPARAGAPEQAGHPNQNPKAAPQPEPHPDAMALASEAAEQFGWGSAAVRAAPAVFQEYLDAGFAPDQVRSVLAAKAGYSCSSARWLEKPLQQAAGGFGGSRLTAEWRPGPADQAFAVELGLDPDETGARFADHYAARPGREGVRADWSAAWRSWCRGAAERAASARSGGMSKYETSVREGMQALMAADRPRRVGSGGGYE